jgi:hypothetical protein
VVALFEINLIKVRIFRKGATTRDCPYERCVGATLVVALFEIIMKIYILDELCSNISCTSVSVNPTSVAIAAISRPICLA